ncbi:cation:proton antiporter [Iamia majanohamensis]|uniref:Cation:proton antiporter n=1 Tax=Iamia majanohamensis TaxID=467976 RepID=A0AAE9YD24_9ACTN|nr:cation:proton antiporter [Iamia majanohamensis]WCO68834.1 cation:proton antiporter [Iamia majanohamensis]
MTPVLGAAGGEAATAFVEIGVVLLVLAVLARLADRWRITAIPLFLLAGLAVGDGGLAPLDVSEDFISLAGEIGVLLLLLTLGLEYTPAELRSGLRRGAVPGVLDAALGFTPGLVAGLLLGWDVRTAVLLGGVCWISSSGVIAKVLSDLGRLGNRETPSVLNLLVLEDLAMAVYLPIVGALLTGRDAAATIVTVGVALAAVGVILLVSMRWGDRLSQLLAPASDESLLLSVFGLTLLVGGVAQRLEVSAAIGAFLVGLAVSDPVRDRAEVVIAPLRDLFAALFFLFFSFQVDLGDLWGSLLPALALLVVTGAGKVVTGWVAARRDGVAVPGRVRAGTVLIARGEFSIVIAALGASAAFGSELATLAAAYVLLTALAGPLLTRSADGIAARLRNAGVGAPAPSPPAPAAGADP